MVIYSQVTLSSMLNRDLTTTRKDRRKKNTAKDFLQGVHKETDSV